IGDAKALSPAETVGLSLKVPTLRHRGALAFEARSTTGSVATDRLGHEQCVRCAVWEVGHGPLLFPPGSIPGANGPPARSHTEGGWREAVVREERGGTTLRGARLVT